MSLVTRVSRRGVVVLGLLLGFFATEARAASVVHTLSYPLTPYLNGGTLAMTPQALPKFNIDGECLTSVCISLDGDVYGEIGFENYDNFAKTVVVQFTAFITLQRPDVSTILVVQPATSTTDNVPAYDGTLDYGGTSGKTYYGVGAGQVDSLCLSSPADLALFSGAGNINLPCIASDASSQVGANSWSIGIKGYAIVTVRYNYVHCETPAERTTWGRIKQSYR